MSPSDLDLIAAMRAYAKDPSGLCFSVAGSRGSVAIFKDDIDGRSDEALLALLTERGASQTTGGWSHRSVHVVA